MTATPRQRVLVIDGARDLRGRFEELLDDAGYEAWLAPAALDIDVVKRLRPDLVIVEPAVGADDRGWRLVRDLAADPDTADLPVVVCTGAARRVREEGEHLARPRVELVLKPFDDDELLHAVAALLDGPAPPGEAPSRLRAARRPGPEGAGRRGRNGGRPP